MIVALLVVAAAAAGPGTAEDFFVSNCTACHTIGGGELDGPDLARATRWSEGDLRVAVERMSENAVPMTPGQIADMIAFLRSPDVVVRLADARRRALDAAAAPEEPASAAAGLALFRGNATLSNGGLACASCHSYRGGGGSLAIALDGAAKRLGQPGLLKAAVSPSWPAMRAVYGKRPVTKREAAHLAAFLAGGGSGAGTTVREGPPVVPALAVLAAAAALLALALRRRNRGVRAALVDATPGRWTR